jgi:6-phosphogluconolactonase
MDAAPHVYVGTYTRQGGSEGIYVYRLDSTSGGLSHVQTVSGLVDPSYLALRPLEVRPTSRFQAPVAVGRFLYAVNEAEDNGLVSAFAVDSATGQLTRLNRVRSGGAHPAHLSVDPSGGWVLVANYTGGTISSLPVQADGSLGEAADVVRHMGSGPNRARQEGPHPHMITSDPDGRFVLVPDLGLDRVLAYRLELSTGRLIAQPDAGGRVAPGAGPRHLAFSPDGRHVYVINELECTLVTFDYDSASGRMTQVQTLSTLPADFNRSEAHTTAAVVVHPSGRFVYGSNRGHNSIAVFGVDPSNGRLTPIDHTPSGGRNPRDFNIDPSGTLLLAANQDSDTIVAFRVDPQTGQLEPTGQVTSVPRPVRVLFSSAS